MNRAAYKERISTVDWSRLSGAYGADFPTPRYLAVIASENEAAAYQALGELLAHVCHQNVLSMLAPEVASWLLKVSEIDEPVHPWVGLFGVVYLLGCAWFHPNALGVPPRPASFAGSYPPDTIKAINIENSYNEISARLLEVVEAATPRLCELLVDSNPKTRAQSARLLAVVSHADQIVAGALINALDHEQDDIVRAGMTVTLACLGTRTGLLQAAALARAHQLLEAPGVWDRIGGVVGLLLLDPDDCVIRFRHAMQAALRFHADDASYIVLQKFSWSNGRAVDLVADALARASLPHEVVIEMLMDAIVEWASQQEEPEFEVEWHEVDLIAMRLLQRTFSSHFGRRDYIQRGDLSAVQLALVARLAPLRIEGDVFGGYGFRDLHRDADRLLGVGLGGLDQLLDGFWDSRSVRWPLWKWWHQASLVDGWNNRSNARIARDYVFAKMRRELSPKQLFLAAQDAASGAYDVPHVPLVRLVASVADSVRDELERYASTIGPEPNGSQAALALIPALNIAGAEALPWLEDIIGWIDRITPPDLKAEAAELIRRR
jgi:hypothetical protein